MEKYLTDKNNDAVSNHQAHDIDLAEDEICFVGHSDHCCVGFVDMVNSTEITMRLRSENDVRSYYAVFLNSMAHIARRFDARVVKIVGDALIFYFPATADSSNEDAFAKALDCSMAMLGAANEINAKLLSMQLPSVSYRLSADYGKIDFATLKSSTIEDLYGPVMNVCSKINSVARENGMVVGGDLYRILKSFKLQSKYQFREVRSHSFGFKFVYPVYSVEQRCPTRYGLDFIRGHHGTTDPCLRVQDLAAAEGNIKSRIMLVDDDEDMLFTFESYLETIGHRTDSFSDAREAVNHFSKVDQGHYKLVILDLKMPGIDGLEVHQKLRAIDDRIRILFVSALDTSTDLVKAVSKARLQQLLLRKPVGRARFVRAVTALLA